MPTKIEWTDGSYNPVTGCTLISDGCKHCYAKRMATRLRGRCGYPADDPFKVTLHPDRLDQPLHWKKPRTIFILRVFKVIAESPRHQYVILTKRPERMSNLLNHWMHPAMRVSLIDHTWPLPNLAIGVSVENQPTADERIPVLLRIPAACRFVSYEPALAIVDFEKYIPHNPPRFSERNGFKPMLDGIIMGGESGPGARPMHPDWARSVRDQCAEAGVPFFFKQWGRWFPRSEWEGNPDLKLPDDSDCWERLVLDDCHIFDDGELMHRVGKKAAGRTLDCQTHDALPWGCG